MKLEHLFSPVTINGMTLKNRAVMPAMGTGYGNADGTVGDRLIAYLARRASGGTGLIITEVCAVDPRGKGISQRDRRLERCVHSRTPGLTEAIHREGGKIALQLHHAGRETFEAAAGGIPEAPSADPERRPRPALRGDEPGADRRRDRRLRPGGRPGTEGGVRRRRDPRRPRLSAEPVPLPLFQSANGRIRRLRGEPVALRAGNPRRRPEGGRSRFPRHHPGFRGRD